MIAAERAAAILLAAGRSERFGAGDKLMAPLAGTPLALHAAGMLAGLGFARLIAVCAPDAVQPAEALAALGFAIVRPPRGAGQAASIVTGIAAADGCDAALVALADMPFVPAGHITALLAAADIEGVVASDVGGLPMAPTLFGRAHFAALKTLQGDEGARRLLASATRVPLAPDFARDIDTPDDLAGFSS